MDLDLEKSFDRVNHDKLMARVARKVQRLRVRAESAPNQRGIGVDQSSIQRYNDIKESSLPPRSILEEVRKVGAKAMALPTRASEMVDVMERNSFSANELVRGKLTKVLSEFTTGEAEPYFITGRGGPVAAIISMADLKRVVGILETLDRVREIDEARLAALAENRSASPVVATLDSLFERYGIDPQRAGRIASEIEFE